MRCFLERARVEPSGESVQLCKYHSGSTILVNSFSFPETGSKVIKTRPFVENLLKRQTAAGARAHCTLVKPSSARRNCGVPPERGTRINWIRRSASLGEGFRR